MTTREIRFRAWDKQFKRWCDPEDVALFAIFTLNNNDKDSIYEMTQFTGLKDNQGKEIYEGDKIAINGNIELQGQIIFENGSFLILWDKGNKRRQIMNVDKERIFQNSNISLEVIGNIWET